MQFEYENKRFDLESVRDAVICQSSAAAPDVYCRIKSLNNTHIELPVDELLRLLEHMRRLLVATNDLRTKFSCVHTADSADAPAADALPRGATVRISANDIELALAEWLRTGFRSSDR